MRTAARTRGRCATSSTRSPRTAFCIRSAEPPTSIRIRAAASLTNRMLDVRQFRRHARVDGFASSLAQIRRQLAQHVRPGADHARRLARARRHAMKRHDAELEIGDQHAERLDQVKRHELGPARLDRRPALDVHACGTGCRTPDRARCRYVRATSSAVTGVPSENIASASSTSIVTGSRAVMLARRDRARRCRVAVSTVVRPGRDQGARPSRRSW